MKKETLYLDTSVLSAYYYEISYLVSWNFEHLVTVSPSEKWIYMGSLI
jgi:hypothetical protein